MGNPFFEHPILNSPYEYPRRHWELDGTGQPTQEIIESRRPADFVTPIPKPRRQRGQGQQGDLALGKDAGLSTENQQYAQAAIIRQVRAQVAVGANSPSPNGGSRRKQRDYCATGAITASAIFVHSSARSKQRRRPSG